MNYVPVSNYGDPVPRRLTIATVYRYCLTSTYTQQGARAVAHRQNSVPWHLRVRRLHFAQGVYICMHIVYVVYFIYFICIPACTPVPFYIITHVPTALGVFHNPLRLHRANALDTEGANLMLMDGKRNDGWIEPPNMRHMQRLRYN